ncbi:MAG: hypothetical protein CVU99_06090 [Firmicutes bacterium HGW-Firmicutes-4]|jgi:glycerol kinase|nr:MAG: hypothetical protein CVU99_06090 [Firmicutes bacterium HGW-Firmicutes-4]
MKRNCFLSWLAGVNCPNYNDEARGALVGMTLGTTKAKILRAAMKEICFEMKEMLVDLKDASFTEFKILRITGRAA